MNLFKMLLFLGMTTGVAFADDLSITYLGKRVLQKWTLADLKKLSPRRIQETPPGNGKKVTFEGPTLDQILLESLTTHLSVEERALIDLVVLKEKSGKEVFVPRSFITKYPVVFDHGKIAPPVSSRPKTLDEGLPVFSYFLNDVFEIDLANSKERFEKVYLKNRSDPGAVRGEKFFVQTCLGCHGSTTHKKIYETVLSQTGNMEKIKQHASVPGFPVLTSKNTQSLESYLRAYAQENPAKTPSNP